MVTKHSRGQLRRRKTSAPLKAFKWIATLGLVGLVLYGASQMSGVAYDEDAIGVVSFSTLNARQKRAALKAANQARCDCGCGMTLAQCVSTDMTCPVRETNIDHIRGMVRDAGRELQ
jgi:hypothetical protein